MSLAFSGCGPGQLLGPTFTPTPTSTPTATPTNTPTDTPQPTAAPTLGIGATQVSAKDGMVLVYVPVGEFLMGSTADEISQAEKDPYCPGCFDNEKPQHTVDLDAYWIDQTDVTNAMFAKFVAATNYKTDAEKDGWGIAWDGHNFGQVDGADWRHPNGPDSYIKGRENFPVAQMSWNDAQAYCAWAGRRLPTEAEWEKAARGTDGRIYPWGNQAPDATLANCCGYVRDSTEVDKYPAGASPYGALDMAGTAFQWVADWYGDYASSPSKNPLGPSSGFTRVLRGGGWEFRAERVRAAIRYGHFPDYRDFMSGFRCALSP